MELNQLKNNIQDKAIENWIYKTQKKGTVESITGSGKNFIFLKALYTMPKNRKDIIHLFLAETTERQKDLEAEIEKFNKIFNVDVHRDYTLNFYCYQTVYKWRNHKLGLVGCDEIHDQLSPEYIKFHIYNDYDAIIGLSATISAGQYYCLKRDLDLVGFFGKTMVNKIDMINEIAPICFTYTTSDGQIDGTSRKLNIYVVKNRLNSNMKCVKAGNLKNPFWQTEVDAYKYINNKFNETLVLEQKENELIADFDIRRDLEIKKVASKRSKLLYNLKSKDAIVKILLNRIDEKTIIFGNSLESLERIIPDQVVSSNNTDEENDLIIDKLNKNEIKSIGSFKKLKQGKNLPGLDNCIIKDYYSNEVDFIQKVGRLRQNGDKLGHVFVIVTEGTQEVIWFNKMVQNCTEYNYILCENTNEAIEQYNKYK